MAGPRRTARIEEHDHSRSSPAGAPEAVRIRMLGGFRVSVGSRTIDEPRWRLRKAAALVKLLALAPGHRLHRERAMDLLWPGSGAKAASNNLRQALHAARRTLSPDDPAAGSRHLASEGESLVLRPGGPLWVDVEAFEEAAAAARKSGEPDAYRAALTLYAGELLPEDRYETWAEARRDGLRGTYLGLLLELAKLYEERGRADEAIEVLRRVVAAEPAREEAHVGLMRLYALSGRSGEALGQYERLREALSRELGADPGPASRRLREQILAGRIPSSRPPGASSPPEEPPGAGRHNLPAPRSSFVGREHELVDVKRTLAMTRLLTLTGAGGSGKTRLALEVAKDLVGAYPDGVWLVELASLSEGELVPQAAASALGVREQPGRSLTAALTDSLREKRLLLVLDNCEHLIDACARFVDAVLASCPHLRILATSREPLGVAGEANWRVISLSLPDAHYPPRVEDLTRYEATRLFVERARLRLPTFAPTPENARAIAEACRKLEGMPLAIELATARVTTLTVEQIAERLKDPLGLLTTGSRTSAPRHQTLRMTLKWSHDLLGEPERKLFYRLSVFAGGWTLEAAEAVGAGRPVETARVLDLLSGLVDKSLVVAETGSEGAARYRMLEPVRQYGRECLEESSEAEQVLRSHATFFLALAEQAAQELRGPRGMSWTKRLDREQLNLRVAMAWSLREEDLETAARLGWALWPFWWVRGRFSEGRRWMEEALAKGAAMSASARAKALFVAGTMADGQADYQSAAPPLEESLRLFRELKDERGAAYALSSAGFAAIGQGRHERGISLLEEAVDLSLKVGDKWSAGFMLGFLAVAWRDRGDHARAKRLGEQGLGLSREVGDKQGTSMTLYVLAGLAHASSDHEQATQLFGEGLRLSTEVGDETNVAYYLNGLATVAVSEGKEVRAARLWGAAEALLDEIEATAYIYAPDRSAYESHVAAARSALGEEAFAAAWAQGTAMTPEEAVAYALSEEESAPPTTTPAPEQPTISRPPASLTRREQEIVALVAHGLTNRQIAKELSISEHTAENHVRKILKRLGLRSRVQIATWVAEQGPRS